MCLGSEMLHEVTLAENSTLEEEKKIIDEVWEKYCINIKENRFKRRVKKKRREGARCNLIKVIEEGYGKPKCYGGDDGGIVI